MTARTTTGDRIGASRAIAVMITTYRRVDLLPPLIDIVAEQGETSGRPYRVVLVDNDPDRSAEPVAGSSGAEYVHEAIPGIGAARRAALEAASDDELVVMIDDDVLPADGWLAGLISAWEAHRPTVAMGFVHYVWPEGCDPWVAAGGFLRRDAHPTGTPLTSLATGNVLIDPRQTRRLGVNFDSELGLSGGEDSLFGEEIRRAGGTIIAAMESVAIDQVPPERATVGFVRRRTIAHGETFISIRLGGVRGIRLLLSRFGAAAGALARAAVFELLHLFWRLFGDLKRDATSKRRFWFALGRLRGAFGRRLAEYARPAS